MKFSEKLGILEGQVGEILKYCEKFDKVLPEIATQSVRIGNLESENFGVRIVQLERTNKILKWGFSIVTAIILYLSQNSIWQKLQTFFL